MHAVLLTAAIVLAADCPPQAGNVPTAGRKPATVGMYCPRYTPPVRWYCKRCAGCAGGNCLSTQPPYFGTQPYNYRVEFDYPWSQQPVSNPEFFGPAYDDEEMYLEEEARQPSSRKIAARKSPSPVSSPAKLPTAAASPIRR